MGRRHAARARYHTTRITDMVLRHTKLSTHQAPSTPLRRVRNPRRRKEDFTLPILCLKSGCLLRPSYSSSHYHCANLECFPFVPPAAPSSAIHAQHPHAPLLLAEPGSSTRLHPRRHELSPPDRDRCYRSRDTQLARRTTHGCRFWVSRAHR